MGSKLLPMTLAELCVHALLLEQGLGTRYGEYSRLVRNLGAHDVADAFKEMERLEEQESRALKAGVHGNAIRVLCPLVLTDAELDEALGVWEDALAHVLA